MSAGELSMMLVCKKFFFYSDKELAATRIVMIQEAGGADKSQCINSDRS
jgi:hypothetical protein